MKAWGFFQDEGRRPEEREIQAALGVVGYRHVVLDRERGTVRFDRRGVELDLGGIGKGYAVDRVVELLRRRGVARPSSTSAAAASTASGRRRGGGLGGRPPGPDGTRPRGRPWRCATARSTSRAATPAPS